MHEADIVAFGFQPRQCVTILNHDGGEERCVNGFTLVPYPIPRGCVAGYFPEVNPVIPRSKVDRFSKTPASKRVRVSLIASAAVTVNANT